MIPTIGRIVHYVEPDVSGSLFVRAALIVGVYKTLPDGKVVPANDPTDVPDPSTTPMIADLMIFSDRGNFGAGFIPFSDSYAVKHWSWPPAVPMPLGSGGTVSDPADDQEHA